jgi:hypothetical protein
MSKTPRSHLCSREGTREVRMESELARKHSGFDHVVGKGGASGGLGGEARSQVKCCLYSNAHHDLEH